MLQSGVSGEDRVVRLNNGSGDLRSRVNGKAKLCLLSKVNGKSLHQKRCQARACTTTKGVKDKEPLKATALICHLLDAVHSSVDVLLANCVVAPGIIVGRILLASQELVRVEQLSVGPCLDLVCAKEILLTNLMR